MGALCGRALASHEDSGRGGYKPGPSTHSKRDLQLDMSAEIAQYDMCSGP